MRLRARGFSFIEIMVVLSIVGIIMMIGLPSLRHFVDQSAHRLLQKQVAETLTFAKQAAVSLREPVIVCMSESTLKCDQGEKYLLVFADAYRDASLRDKSQLLTVTSLALQLGSLHVRSYPVYRSAMLFLPTNAERGDNGTWWYCAENAGRADWAVVVTAFGEVRLLDRKQAGYLRC